MLKQHRFLIPVILLIVIFFSFLLGWWLSLPRGDELPASIRIEPSEREESGVTTGSAFLLTSGFSLKEDALRSILELEPALNYTLSGGGKEWILQPVMPLRENMVYTFRVKNNSGTPVQSFAFQTRSDLLVNDVFPRDSAYVDIDTGIEMRFNRPGVDISKGFQILPPVSGRFVSQDYTCRFIPDAPLKHNSIYRITLSNLSSTDGAVLQTPFTFSFQTSEEEGAESWDDLSLEQASASFIPGDEMRIRLYGGDQQAKASYTMTLHKYPGINAYANALRERDKFYQEQYGVKTVYHLSTDGLDEVMNTEGQLMENNGDLYAPLPDNLSEGYYIFTLSGEVAGKEQFAQQMIQVVNLGLYMQSVGGDTLFWMGDPISQGPVKDAVVELETLSGEKISGKANENGVASFSNGESKNSYVTILRDGTPVWFSGSNLSVPQEERPLSWDYYSAIYTDREIYLPGDPIHFWGVVKPRNHAPMPDSVWVSLATMWPSSTLSGMEVQVKDGIFSGVLNPGSLRTDHYQLKVGNGADGAYIESSLTISEYTKPAYQISLSTDKDFYYYGETITFYVSAKYYDGTPAAGVKLTADSFEANLNDYPITLDQSGKAEFKAVLNPSHQQEPGQVASWTPNTVFWSVNSADGQPVNLYQSDTFFALPSKIAAEMTYEGDGRISIQTAVLDDTKLKAAEKAWIMGESQFQQLQGVPADIPMTLVVHKVVFHQIQTGSWYDYVNKRNVPVYKNQREETVERNIQVSSVTGKAEVTDLPFSDSSGTIYWYELRFAGGVYGDVCETITPVSPYRDPDWKQYQFLKDPWGIEIAPGDSMEIGVWENEQKIENPLFLYTVVQDKILNTQVSQGDSTFSMEEKHLPNIWLAGAYFDGHSMHEIQSTCVKYDYTDRTLQVTAEPDKTEYRPGETMNVKISIADQDGNPVSGKAAVGIVDESIFDLSFQEIDLAGQIYTNIYYPNIIQSIAAGNGGLSDIDIQDDAPAAGGMNNRMKEAASADRAPMNTGGGGMELGASIRSLFLDTADFQTLDVSAAGSEVSIQLPDNVTSWRITAAAVTTDLKAGNAVSNAAATMPFYLQTILTESYLTGDDIAVSALAVGTALDQGNVRYTAQLSGGTLEETQKEQETLVGNRAVFNFGKLPAGAYQVTLSAQYGEYQDAVTLPLSVTDTGLLLPSIETVELSALSEVKSAAWPVEIIVADNDAKPVFDALSWLTSRHGRRTENIVGSIRGLELYNELRPEDQREPVIRDNRFDSIQGDNGGVRILPESQEDAALTAQILMAAPELIHQGKAISFLHDVLKNPAAPQDDRIMAYVGLAAAKEPVLLDLRRLYEQDGADMKPYLRLYTGAAFAWLGDFERANEIYESVKILHSNSEAHVDDSDVRATAAALLLASDTGKMEDAAEFARYLTGGSWESGKEGSLPNLELLAYAKKAFPKETNGSLTYEENGKTKEVELKDGAAFLTLDEKNLRNGKFRSQSGKLSAAVKGFRMGSGDAVGDFASISKSYEPLSGSLTPGSQVQVTVTVKFNENSPYGTYTLTDSIPSGLRWLGGSHIVTPQNGSMWVSFAQDGQRITGTVHRPAPNGPDLPVPVPRVESAYVRFLPAHVEPAESDDITDESEASSSVSKTPPDVSGNAEGNLEPDPGEMTEEPQENEIAQEDDTVEDEIYNPVDLSGHLNRYQPNDPSVQEQEDPNTLVFTYYLSAALPGSFITESTWLSWENDTVKSDRGTISISE